MEQYSLVSEITSLSILYEGMGGVGGEGGEGGPHYKDKQRVLMHRHQGWNVRHSLCHINMRYLYIYMSCL